jgi:hypothetical protein
MNSVVYGWEVRGRPAFGWWILQLLKDKYLNYALIMFCMTELFMYHVFCCVNELLLNAMACLIVAVTYIFYSEI